MPKPSQNGMTQLIKISLLNSSIFRVFISIIYRDEFHYGIFIHVNSGFFSYPPVNYSGPHACNFPFSSLYFTACMYIHTHTRVYTCVCVCTCNAMVFSRVGYTSMDNSLFTGTWAPANGYTTEETFSFSMTNYCLSVNPHGGVGPHRPLPLSLQDVDRPNLVQIITVFVCLRG